MINSYGILKNEDYETEIIIDNINSFEKSIKLTRRMIKNISFDYMAGVYTIKGYFPNDNDRITLEGIKLSQWASQSNENNFHAGVVERYEVHEKINISHTENKHVNFLGFE